MTALDEIKDFATFRDNGITYEGKPMIIHQKNLRTFLLFYKGKTLWEEEGPTEDDVLGWMLCEFNAYCKSKEFHDDDAEYSRPRSTTPMRSYNGAGNYGGSTGTTNTGSIASAGGPMTAQEFRRAIKRDKTHYEDLTKDSGFSLWNRNFTATAHMHHKHLVLDENYVPQDDNEKAVFREMQTFMYAVMADHLKTDKGKALFSQYEGTRDAQSIYWELVKHALASTSA
jgi:hypothetical protein